MEELRASSQRAEDKLKESQQAAGSADGVRKLEAELRALKSDQQQMEAEWQECDAKRLTAEKERQKLKAAATALEEELQSAREEAEREQKDAAELRRQTEQLRRALQDGQTKKGILGQTQPSDVDEVLGMLRELPALLLLWDQHGKLRHVAGGGLELLGWRIDQQLEIKIEAVAESGEPPAEPIRSVLADQDYSQEVEQSDRTLSLRCTPWKNDLGAVRGLLGLVTDLTAQRRAEAKAKRLEAQLTAKARERRNKNKSDADIRPGSSAEFVGPTMRLLPYEEEADAEPTAEGPLPTFAGRVLHNDDRREPQRVMTFL